MPHLTQLRGNAMYGAAMDSDGEHVVVSGAGNVFLHHMEWFAEVGKFPASAKSRVSTFGAAVAIDRGMVAVGAPFGTVNGVEFAGEVYLFDKHSGELLHIISELDLFGAGQFGWSLDLKDCYLAVGVSKARDQINSHMTYPAVVLYNAHTGERLYTMRQPEMFSQDGEFGTQVVISGSHLVVSAPQARIDGWSSGKLFVFDLTTGTHLRTITVPEGSRLRKFDGVLAAKDDYLVIVAGDEGVENSEHGTIGAVFRISTGEHVRDLIATIPYKASDEGYSIAVDDDWIAVGALDLTASDRESSRYQIAVHLFDWEGLERAAYHIENKNFSSCRLTMCDGSLFVGVPYIGDMNAGWLGGVYIHKIQDILAEHAVDSAGPSVPVDSSGE